MTESKITYNAPRNDFNKIYNTNRDTEEFKNICSFIKYDPKIFVQKIISAQNENKELLVLNLINFISKAHDIQAIDLIIMNDEFNYCKYWRYTNEVFTTQLVIHYINNTLSKNNINQFEYIFGLPSQKQSIDRPLFIESFDYNKVLTYLTTIEKSYLKRHALVIINILLISIWYKDEDTFEFIVENFRIDLFPKSLVIQFFENVMNYIPYEMFIKFIGQCSLNFINDFMVNESFYEKLAKNRKDLTIVLRKYNLSF